MTVGEVVGLTGVIVLWVTALALVPMPLLFRWVFAMVRVSSFPSPRFRLGSPLMIKAIMKFANLNQKTFILRRVPVCAGVACNAIYDDRNHSHGECNPNAEKNIELFFSVS